MKARELMDKTRRLVGEPQDLIAEMDLRADLIGEQFGDGELRRRAIVGPPEDEYDELLAGEVGHAAELVRERARAGLTKLADDGEDADLAPEEAAATEAVVVAVGRPALLIQDGRFFPPPPRWEHLEEDREQIQATLASVGRIEVSNHPALDWVGTGFLVAPDVVMTNRHVVKEFALPSGGSRWDFDREVRARIDWAEELGSVVPREFTITQVLGVHESLDLALLRVESQAEGELPAPLTPIAASEVDAGSEIYVVGYPSGFLGSNDAEVVRRIFSGVYNIKRLQPGEVLGIEPAESQFTHDASTLQGNSGSCVVDLASHQPVGLHYQGSYRRANWAVSLWTLRNDPLLRGAGVEFA